MEQSLDDLFAYLREAIRARYPRYKGVLEKMSTPKCLDHYGKLSIAEKYSAMLELLAMLHCNASFGLKALNLSSASGRMNMLNIGGSISDVTFIDTSVTGMLERRSVIEP